MSDYNVTFAGLPLESPIIIETADERIDLSVIQECRESGAGGVLFPLLNDERLNRVADASEITEHNQNDSGTRASERILRRLNTEDHLDRLEEAVRRSGVPVIAALQCDNRRQWFPLAQQMREAGAAAIEIRPFIPDRHRSYRSDHIEKSIIRTTAHVSDRLEAPLIVRIPALFHGTQAFVQALTDAGAAAVTIEPPQELLAIDVDAPTLSDPESDRTAGYAAFVGALTTSRMLYRRVNAHIAIRLPESSSSTLVMALLGGASLVTVPVSGSDSENAGQTVRRYLTYLKKWMTAHNASSLFDFRGSLSESRIHSSLEN